MKILTFNILAQVFANVEKYYPPGTNVDATFRRNKFDCFLSRIVDSLDVIGLQEVSNNTTQVVNGESYFRPGEYPHISSYLSQDFHCFFAPHSPSYWEKYYDADPTSPFAYIDNGNALFLRKSVFRCVSFRTASMSSGQRVPIADTTYQGLPLSFAVVHLDSDVPHNRKQDLEDLMNLHLASGNCVVLGDYNSPTNEGNLVDIIQKSGLVDLITTLANQFQWPIDDRTRPDSTGTYNSNKFELPIDHICARGLTVNPVLANGVHGTVSGTKTGVIDFLLWQNYPINGGKKDPNEPGRFSALLEACGSDHFPVVVTVN